MIKLSILKPRLNANRVHTETVTIKEASNVITNATTITRHRLSSKQISPTFTTITINRQITGADEENTRTDNKQLKNKPNNRLNR